MRTNIIARHSVGKLYRIRGENLKGTIIRIVFFLTILIMILLYWNRVFKPKYSDGIYDLTTYYGLEENTVDVLVLGTSHAFEDFNTGTLWDEYGISAYVLGGSMQPMWNTYYYLREALKTQKPKVIVLEGYAAIFQSDYMEESNVIKNNYGLKWSRNKIRSLDASVPAERLGDFVLAYPHYHARYNDIGRTDFVNNQGNPMYDDWKGFGCNMNTKQYDSIDIRQVMRRANLNSKTELYYKSIINLAKENDIPIVIVISPYAGINESNQEVFNRVGDIAEEQNVPYLNCNLLVEEIDIDYSTDVADADHLNYKGNQKFSRYIGEYLCGNFDIPDHRGDSRYDSWENQADYIRQLISDQELVETESLRVLLEMTTRKPYVTVVSVDDSSGLADGDARDFLNVLNIQNGKGSGIWLYNGGDTLWNTETSSYYYRKMGSHDMLLQRKVNPDGEYTNSVIIDKEEYVRVNNGINVVVYDPITEKIATSFGIDFDDKYKLLRF